MFFCVTFHHRFMHWGGVNNIFLSTLVTRTQASIVYIHTHQTVSVWGDIYTWIDLHCYFSLILTTSVCICWIHARAHSSIHTLFTLYTHAVSVCVIHRNEYALFCLFTLLYTYSNLLRTNVYKFNFFKKHVHDTVCICTFAVDIHNTLYG